MYACEEERGKHLYIIYIYIYRERERERGGRGRERERKRENIQTKLAQWLECRAKDVFYHKYSIRDIDHYIGRKINVMANLFTKLEVK